MTGATLDRPHVWLPGAAARCCSCTGTGGDEHGLVPPREHLAPVAPVLSPRRTMLE